MNSLKYNFFINFSKFYFNNKVSYRSNRLNLCIRTILRRNDFRKIRVKSLTYILESDYFDLKLLIWIALYCFPNLILNG